jgi:alpha-galactosidase
MIRLDGGGETLVLALGDGPPALAYWGPELPARVDLAMVAGLAERATPHGMLDGGEALDLFPEAGRGFTGQPALEVHRVGGGFVTQLAYAGASPLDDGVALTLVDLGAGVEVVLWVTLDAATGVAGFRSRLTNLGPDDLAVDWMAAATLPMIHDEVMLFEGRWSREFHPVRQRLAVGAIAQDNRTGRTSHHAPPFAMIGQPGFGDLAGEVTGLHLAWSGDHRMWVERLRDGRIQAQAGELFLPGEMILAPGAAYETPVLYAARSTTGLNGLSDRFHPFVRDVVLGGRLKGKPRPVHFNTWEAVYFRHELSELKGLAELAAQVGAERFVLDDGWFKGRDDDTTSLGDWTPDPVKYPDGLGPLIDHVRGLGLEFGLWVEPEMANAASDLLRAHPDWTLHVAGRDQPLGRGQYVLDLTRPEVAGHVFDQISALLARHPIGYLKWDMNRDLTHAASGGRPASHAQTLAVYGVIDRLRAAHPGVEIESCASGGGRADYEILRRTDRVWTSDCNDPQARQAIQRGFSIFFPPEVMGAHVGPAKAHTTGRRASLTLRAFTALFGHMGIEADVRDFPEADRGQLADAIARHKTLRPRLHGGRTLRLEHSDPGAVAFVVVDEAGALASFAQLEVPAQASPAPLRLAGLDAAATYRVTLLNPPRHPGATMKLAPALALGETATATGAMLMTMGLPLPVLRAGEIAVFQIDAVQAARI